MMRLDRNRGPYRQTLERKLGRKLAPGELAHHINEDKTDNSPANLEPKTRSAHTTHHNKTRGLGKLQKALTMHKRGEKLY